MNVLKSRGSSAPTALHAPNPHTPIPRNKRQHWRPACQPLIARRQVPGGQAPRDRQKTLAPVGDNAALFYTMVQDGLPARRLAGDGGWGPPLGTAASAEEVSGVLHLLQVEGPCGAEQTLWGGPPQDPTPSEHAGGPHSHLSWARTSACPAACQTTRSWSAWGT